MKNTLLVSLALAMPALALPQSAGYAIHVDLKSGDVTRIGTVEIGEFKDFRIFRLTFGDLKVNAIVALNSGTSLGFSLGKTFKVANNAEFITGFSARTVQEIGSDKIKFRTGVIAGLTYRF